MTRCCDATVRSSGVYSRQRAIGFTVTYTELVELRPLVLPARDQTRRAAEFSITLAVCSALGDLGDTLWREREPSQPLLALRRFADLGGR